jgi:hypothetical protein
MEVNVPVGLIILLCLLGWGQEGTYLPVPWDALVRDDAETGLVRIRGRYLPFEDYQELVRGVLVYGRHALRVDGEVFDWRPQEGAWVEFWGELQRDAEGYLLHFHNGRRLGDLNRAPRPTPQPVLGKRARIWLKVRRTGSEPFPLTMGTTEDGKVFFLSPDYEGPWETVCLEGIIGTLGKFWSLQGVTLCVER